MALPSLGIQDDGGSMELVADFVTADDTYEYNVFPVQPDRVCPTPIRLGPYHSVTIPYLRELLRSFGDDGFTHKSPGDTTAWL